MSSQRAQAENKPEASQPETGRLKYGTMVRVPLRFYSNLCPILSIL